MTTFVARPHPLTNMNAMAQDDIVRLSTYIQLISATSEHMDEYYGICVCFP